MKSLKEYSMNIPESEYHAHPAWNHSKISEYATKGFSCMATIRDPKAPSTSMEFGSLFDSIVTRGKATMDEYVVSDTVPTPAEKAVLDKLLTMTDVPFYDIPSSTMEEAINACDYQRRWNYKTQLEHISVFSSYYDIKAKGRKIISSQDWNDALEMYREFRKDEYINSLFGHGEKDGIEYIYQPQFLTKMRLDDLTEADVRIMFDLLKVDHNNKTVQPVDLKTSAQPAYDFAENFIRFRYDIQASMYSDVLRDIMDRTDEYKDYIILPYVFVDISRSDKVPVSYAYDQTDPSQVDGLSFKDYHYKGWKALLAEMIHYEEENAVVPSYIKTGEPNDMIKVLSR